MKPEDWKQIRYFTAAEIRKTGANPEDVDRTALSMLDQFRALVGCPVILFQNGVTTGEHSSPGHKAGRAFDCYLAAQREFRNVLGAAVKAGFTAIGVYWNGTAYSYHLEHDPEAARLWTGRKGPDGKWIYGALLIDPAEG